MVVCKSSAVACGCVGCRGAVVVAHNLVELLQGFPACDHVDDVHADPNDELLGDDDLEP